MAMNNEEKKALSKKLYDRDAVVKCPRCGNEIVYEEIGNSIIVKCETENCISGGVRGL